MTTQVKRQPITLFSFVSETYTHSIQNLLLDLGNSVNLVNGWSWNNDQNEYKSGVSVLLLGEDNLIQEQRLDSIVSRLEMGSYLAVYSHPISKIIKTIVCASSESCVWPCQSQEFEYRLERLLSKKSHTKTTFYKKHDSNNWKNLNLVGSFPCFTKALELIKKSADCDAAVLIEGQTGTGKEMAARAIHYLSARCDYPFIPVNCGAIPEALVENELFGHEKGAYTDAKQNQSGLIAQAEGGTLFLDEIEAMPLKAQVSLLRFTEDQIIKPLGSMKEQKVNVRIIAASNSPLLDLVSQGCFRQDLLFRLNLLSFSLPALKDRISDVPLLAEHFMSKFRKQYQQSDKQLHSDTLEWMGHYDWPGNVRELENFIHRQFLLTDDLIIRYTDQKITNHQWEPERRGMDRNQQFNIDSSFQEVKARAIEQFEQGYLTALLAHTQGNITKAAQCAHKERRALGKLIKKHNLKPDQFH